MLVEPDFFGWLAFGEEENIGFDPGIWVKYAIWQTNNGVYIALFGQQFLDFGFDAFTKQCAIWQNYGCTAFIGQHFNDQLQE